MPVPKTPRVLIFDIGGVCVGSPMQGIRDYERSNSLPSNWINFAIRHSSPNGHWQRLERGEIKLDDDFFTGFASDLQSEEAWRAFHHKDKKPKLKDLANPTLLGDPTSLKAEAAESSPTDQDRGAASATPLKNADHSSPEPKKPRLKDLANPTLLGDPTSLKAESADSSPTDQDRGAASPPPPKASPPTTQSTPPTINPKPLLAALLAPTAHPSPQIHPLLLSLSRLPLSSGRPILVALSNNIPPSAYSPPSPSPAFNPKELFDIQIYSTEVGLRKPDPRIYELAMARIRAFAVERGVGEVGEGGEVEGGECVFLDDIGENLRAARGKVGWRTIKVNLGREGQAVRELEGMMGKGRGGSKL